MADFVTISCIELNGLEDDLSVDIANIAKLVKIRFLLTCLEIISLSLQD